MRVVYQGASVHQHLLVSSEVARSVRDPFPLTQEKKDHASTVISRFSAKDYSDHMALVHAYEGWKEAEREGSAYEYCWRAFLSAQTLQAIHSIRHQFIHILKDAQLLETKLGINTSSYTFFKESHRIRCISRVWNHVSCEGSTYTWELSSGAKLVYLTHYRESGSIVSCLMADDSGSSGVFCSGCASPSTESMVRSLEVLYSLGVLDDDAKLTSPVGFQVAELPLDPMVSKMIIASDKLECLEEIITIATILSVQRELDEAKLRFAASERAAKKSSTKTRVSLKIMTKQDSESISEATSGAIGAVLSTTILYPLDTYKAKYQAEVRMYDINTRLMMKANSSGVRRGKESSS
ncbi:unnamed protein product [Lactuca saligna]|uniref:RNA helicase n=1 Tax=Lactuca saligna TaxID=75948 RepID=A0AA35ZLM8_LACSI|nr:unnamed protein product [Lactuca saligna]